MKNLRGLFVFLTLFTGGASAQITGSGNFQSIPGLFSDIFGINVSDPYNALGLLATFSVMWVSTYVIFKVSIKKLDGDTGRRGNGGFADSLGLTSEEDTNLLAILTLLITLTVLGTGAFYGLLRGWQAMILFAFVFMLLAGTIFILIGGTGLLFGGGSYMAGKTAKSMMEGVKEVKEASEMIEREEETVEKIEKGTDEEEDDIKDRESRGEGGDDGTGEGGSKTGRDGDESEGGSGDSTVEREVEDVIQRIERTIQLINDVEDNFDESLEQELENMKNDLQTMKRILKALGVEDGSEGLNALRNVLSRAGFSDDELEELFDLSRDSSSARSFYSDLIDRERPLSMSTSEAESLRDYIEELNELESGLEVMRANAYAYKGLEQLLERLEDDLEHLEDEESALENLLSHLGTASREMFEEVKHEKEQLRNLESKIEDIEELDQHLGTLRERLEKLKDRLGEFEGTESIFNALDLRKLLAETVAESGSSDVNTSKFIHFDPEAEEVSLTSGLVLLPSGDSRTTVEVDMDMSAGRPTSQSPFEFKDTSRGLISLFEGEMEDFIRSNPVNGKADVEKELFNLFGHISREIADYSSRDSSGRIKLSEGFKSISSESSMLNAIYFGFLIYNFRQIYDYILTEAGDPDSHIGAWRPVRQVMKEVNVYLGVYQTSSGKLPCVFVQKEGSYHCFSPSTGEMFQDVGDEHIGDLRFISNS